MKFIFIYNYKGIVKGTHNEYKGYFYQFMALFTIIICITIITITPKLSCD
jgi:hypothetical protein